MLIQCAQGCQYAGICGMTPWAFLRLQRYFMAFDPHSRRAIWLWSLYQTLYWNGSGQPVFPEEQGFPQKVKLARFASC